MAAAVEHLGQILRSTMLRERGSSLAGQADCGKLIALNGDDLLKPSSRMIGTIQIELAAEKAVPALKFMQVCIGN